MSSATERHLSMLCLRAVSVIADSAKPLGSAALADAMEIHHETAQSVVCKLILQEKIESVGRCANQRPVYRLKGRKLT